MKDKHRCLFCNGTYRRKKADMALPVSPRKCVWVTIALCLTSMKLSNESGGEVHRLGLWLRLDRAWTRIMLKSILTEVNLTNSVDEEKTEFKILDTFPTEAEHETDSKKDYIKLLE